MPRQTNPREKKTRKTREQNREQNPPRKKKTRNKTREITPITISMFFFFFCPPRKLMCLYGADLQGNNTRSLRPYPAEAPPLQVFFSGPDYPAEA